jgi:sarcosine oxidase
VPQIPGRALRRTTYDVIVVGVGGMGSAACYHLARRGRTVLGLERFTVPNEMGSSHGVTRIIRLAYYEDPRYVPLLRRAYELWRQLELDAGRRLLHITGCLELGRPDSSVVAGALRSCREHDLAHEELTAAEVNRRFGAWRLPPELVAVLEPQGGFVEPEACIEAHASLAADCGAEIHAGERVTHWEARSGGVRVTTEQGIYDGRTLVLSAGAWAATLEPMLADLAVPERQVLGWFDMARPEQFAPDAFPVFVAEVDEGHYYGFPHHAVPGFKIGRFHHRHQVVAAEHVDRATHAEDEAVLRAFNRRYVPDADGALLDSRVCMFTNSPDQHFIIDRHPGHPEVLIAAGFSGHGYKFCSVVGEILADLASDGHTDHAIGFLSLGRFR